MRVAYLDCFSGMSGDMFLGALVDAGVSRELLEETVTVLGIGARLEISRVNRSGITATKVNVYAHGEKDLPREAGSGLSALGSGEHHGHGHHHEHDHDRGLNEIRGIIGKAAIGDRAKKMAIAIFEALGAAEAKIHDLPIEKVHFHEVGAMDAMVDIVCAAVEPRRWGSMSLCARR